MVGHPAAIAKELTVPLVRETIGDASGTSVSVEGAAVFGIGDWGILKIQGHALGDTPDIKVLHGGAYPAKGAGRAKVRSQPDVRREVLDGRRGLGFGLLRIETGRIAAVGGRAFEAYEVILSKRVGAPSAKTPTA